MGDTGRVSVFPLLHMWPDTFGVTAYATTGHFGDTAVVGRASAGIRTAMDVTGYGEPSDCRPRRWHPARHG